MLQQGLFVADIAYLLDEGAPSTMPIWGTGLNPAPPEGYDYDYINADVLIDRISVSAEGRLTLPDGMSYGILVLPESERMTLPVLRKIGELVKEGATVVGPRPVTTPGYSGYQASEMIFNDMVSDIWGDLDGVSRTRRETGKGKLFWGTPVRRVLELAGIKPDLEYYMPLDCKVDWIHRRSGGTDFFFLVNSSDSLLDTRIRFRITGREPEFWDPATGTAIPAGYSMTGNNTVVPVHFKEREALFVVFRNKTDQTSRADANKSSELITSLSGPWELTFPAGMGAPEKITLPELESWSVSRDDGIKYFSGTATYTGLFSVKKSLLKKDAGFVLDLGKVCDMAEVSINGSQTALLWKPPFTTDISGLLHKGKNKIEIKITNQWTNRLIGDLKAPADKKILGSSIFMRGREPAESGLIGPVRIFKLK